MGVSWESVWGLRESVLSQFFASQSRELRSCWVQTPKQTPNRLPIGCPEGTFPYFRVAISAVKSVKCVSSRLLITQRSLVQIQPPQPKKLLILNGFRYDFGGCFCVWREFRQILGKEFLVKKCSKFPGHANIIRCHQMRVSHAQATQQPITRRRGRRKDKDMNTSAVDLLTVTKQKRTGCADRNLHDLRIRRSTKSLRF